jgi:hypothetical protein
MRIVYWVCGGITLILLQVFLCPAQTVPTYRTTTRLVEVSVIATDKNGPVGDLTKDDFVLYDNGKNQSIAFFEEFSRQALREAATTAPAKLPPGEFSNRSAQSLADRGEAVIIVFDALNTGITDQMIAKKAILKTLEAVHAGDHVGIYILGLETKGDSRSGAVDVIVIERDLKGVELSRTKRALAFDIEEQKYDAFLKAGLRVTFDLNPQPTLAEVKVVVLDRTSGRIGSLTIPVQR